MKTKFFKKLSFVLVVAMVLSLFVPAAGVFAAAKPSLNSKNKYLHLSGNPGPNEYNFNIKNKKKGWSYEWESDNEAIAEVNVKNGVTVAKAVGKTKVTVYITDKNGEEVETLSANVTVRDNIKEVSISNPVEKLAVGEAHDYNRSYVTEANSTKKTSSITRWTVSPDTATIDDKGVFVATEGGEYTVTALSFQSKAKYNDWKADAEKYADYVLDTDETKVVVSANIVGVTQLDKTKFNVEFDSSMADTDLSATTALVYQVINGKLYNTGTEKIKSLSLDTTGKIATVEIYGNLYGKTVYQFAYGDLKDEFTAASNEVSDIAGIVFEDFQVKTDGSAVNMLDKVNAVNADGVVILSGHDISGNLKFEYAGDYAYGWIAGTNAYINKEGYNAKITAKYDNFVFDKETSTYKNVKFEDDAIATGVKILLSNTTMQYAVTQSVSEPSLSDGSKWATTGFSIPAGDGSYIIYTRYKNNTDPSWAGYTSGLNAGADKFKYVSTDSDKLVINGRYIYAAAQGVVTVLVQDPANNNATVGSFDITVVASRAYASAEVSEHAVSLGNFDFTQASDEEVKVITVTNKDSMGDKLRVTGISSTSRVYGPANANSNLIVTAAHKNALAVPGDWDYGLVDITVKAVGATKGAYQYKVDLSALNSSKTINVFINVLDGAVADPAKPEESVVRWAVEFNSDNVDLKKQKADKVVEVNVYGYNSHNARVFALNNSQYSIDVKKGSSSTDIKSVANIVAKSGDTTTKNIPVSYFATGADSYATGAGLAFVDLSSYVVTAKAIGSSNPTGRGAGVEIAAQTFTVGDTTTLTPVLENWSVSVSSYGTVDAAIKQAFKFKINDDDISETAGVFTYKVTRGGSFLPADGSTVVAQGDNLRVEEVYYITTWDGGTSYVKYTFNVGQTITISK